jgi:hypothetical protein
MMKQTFDCSPTEAKRQAPALLSRKISVKCPEICSDINSKWDDLSLLLSSGTGILVVMGPTDKNCLKIFFRELRLSAVQVSIGSNLRYLSGFSAKNQPLEGEGAAWGPPWRRLILGGGA